MSSFFRPFGFAFKWWRRCCRRRKPKGFYFGGKNADSTPVLIGPNAIVAFKNQMLNRFTRNSRFIQCYLCLDREDVADYSPPFVVSSDFIACPSSQNDRPPRTLVFWIANQNKDSKRPEKLLDCRTRSILKIMSSYRTSRHSVGFKGFNTLYNFF